VTLTATDANGNVSSATAKVTIEDKIAPIVVTKDIIVQLDATGNVSIVTSDIDNGSTDACGTPVLTVSPSTFTCANVGNNTVTLTGKDANGNVSSATAIVTIEDKIAPVVATKDIIVQLDATGNTSILASEVDNASSDACGTPVLTVSPDTFTCANVGSNTVTLTATDANGNVSSATAIVTIEDKIAATVVTKDITVQLDATGNASILASEVDNGSTDACGTPVLTVSPNTFTCVNIGNNNVTLTATDANGNVSSATAKVTIEDKIAPIVVTKDIIVQLDATGNASILASEVDNGSTDACGTPVLTVSPDTFTCPNVGNNTVILTATDANGNVSSATAIVKIEDKTPATVVTKHIIVQLDATGNASILASEVDNGSTDACGTPVLTVSPNTFTCANIGNNTVTLTATDASGNVSSKIAIVTIENKNAPIALAKNSIVQLNATGNATITAADINNGSTTTCGTPALTISPSTFTCANVGANTVTLTVTDANGSVSSATAIVTVQDKIAPVVLVKNATVQLDASGNVSITASQIDNGSSDTCGIASITVTPSTFTCATVGANQVTLKVTDVNGNVATATATVMVEDLILPTAKTRNVSVKLDDAGNASITVNEVNNGSSDNCGIASVSVSKLSFDCTNVGANNVVLTVTDKSGNKATATAIVTVTNTFGDNDNDGILDNCDADDDNDGIADAVDNCPITANPYQEDRNHNGLGDACDKDQMNISEAFTPNGDGINDTWVISNIENYPASVVRVFNRWGAEVFVARNYQNDWDGQSKGNSSTLPAASSYYYQIDLDGNGSIDKQGWIYINR
jgi:gliding motility-associated-like protein